MDKFLSFRVHEVDGKPKGGLEEITLDDLDEGNVVIKAAWSELSSRAARFGYPDLTDLRVESPESSVLGPYTLVPGGGSGLE